MTGLISVLECFYFCGVADKQVHIFQTKYRNDPKFSDRQVWANSVDPDQTAPRGAVWSGSTMFAILSALFGHSTRHKIKLLGSFSKFFGCPNFQDFYGTREKVKFCVRSSFFFLGNLDQPI